MQSVEATAIVIKRLAEPDEHYPLEHGEMQGVDLLGSLVWRSVLRPGWSWDSDIKPMVGGESCPETHREYVEAGTVRYLMLDGSETIARAGDVLFIPPGHRAWVVGNDDCILIDW